MLGVCLCVPNAGLGHLLEIQDVRVFHWDHQVGVVPPGHPQHDVPATWGEDWSVLLFCCDGRRHMSSAISRFALLCDLKMRDPAISCLLRGFRDFFTAFSALF